MSSDQTGQLLGSQAQRIRDVVIRIQNDKAHSFIAVVAYVFGNRHCFRPQGWNGEGRGKSKRAHTDAMHSVPKPVLMAQKEEELVSEAR